MDPRIRIRNKISWIRNTGLKYLDEVHEDVAEALHVVPSALLNAEVGVDAGVARRPRQVLVLPVGDVLVGPRITVLLRQAKVNDVDQVALLTQAPAANPIRVV
jgi:hypothetical protein